MRAARDFCRGLRIMRQPRWECLATFITSSMKQVAHIRQISHALRERFGEAQRILDCDSCIPFPAPPRHRRSYREGIARSARSATGRKICWPRRGSSRPARSISKRWSELPDDELRAPLCELPGVGAKVANCVMLFAYERLRAFPIDVWIERVLSEKYFPRKRKVTATQLQPFAQSYFGEHGGYAQQYLFHHARKAAPHPAGSEMKIRAARLLGRANVRYYPTDWKALQWPGQSIVEQPSILSGLTE